ncbi:hypothetical protein RJ55_07740 [Drechmeria coniospora]|nr:hypothetical protein RJ55_07740 [Drechmeria coniospora]
MTFDARRLRSLTSTSTPTPTSTPDAESSASLRRLLASLDTVVNDAGDNAYPDPHLLDSSLQDVARCVCSESTTVHQDDFRHAGGFESVLAVLRRFSGFYDPHKRAEADMLALFGLLASCLKVLAAALRDHPANRRFFRCRVDGGGWEALEQVIASIGLGGAEPDPWVSCHVFGQLLSFSLDDDAFDLLGRSIGKMLRPDAESSDRDADGDVLDKVARGVQRLINGTTAIRFPEMLRAVVSFWTALPRPAGSSACVSSIFVLEAMLRATSVSMHNRAAVHSTGVLSQFLHVAFGHGWLAEADRERLLAICQLLMFLGVNEPADTQFLLSAPRSEAADFCLEMMSKHAGPPFFQFDLTLHGYSSLELPSLGRSFPPQSAAGYTFTAWMRVEAFDPAAHTTIFGLYDASQTCFVLVYLEKDTRNFILQTSVFSNKPSVRFKSVAFREKKWYHVAVVHRRPKTMTASKAALYVDGEFAEQVRCSYPQPPPPSNGSNESFASFSSNQNRTNPVQAFVGTPRELSARTGSGVVHTRWALASAHLFEDVLSDDYLAVHFGLGPRYQGNFQDSLGGFQTYRASAALGLRNEIVHPGKDEHSEILRAVRDKASSLLPESKILLSLLPSATFAENVQFLDTGLLRSLPRVSTRNLFRISNQEGGPLAMNCAVPNLSDALFRTHGVASFRGTPIVAAPSYLDENLWRLAGFTPLALKLLERATTAEETIRAIEIMFHCIRKSWRNSEAMERDNGYGILGMLLRFKMGYGNGEPPVPRLFISVAERDSLAFRVLSLMLDFLGYNHAEPIESFIVNPLAYRMLLIDLDIWRRSAPRIQELYYKQFLTFAVNSKHHEFNSRRLIRMRTVKRLLDAMKGESISDDVIDHFMNAFQALVKSSLSQEVMRSLSLFITYAFQTSARTACKLDGESPVGYKMVTKKQLGARILTMYSHILCEKGNLTNIKTFGRTVSNKWLLYLLDNDDATVVLHSCRILTRQLVANGGFYTSKFAVKAGGWAIMANRLKRFWDTPSLWPMCFSILFGYDVADVTLHRELSTLVGLFSARKVAYPEASLIINTMLQHGMREVMKREDAGARHPGPADAAADLETRLTFKVDGAALLLDVLAFLKQLHALSSEFRNFALTSEWVRMLLAALYPVIVSTDVVTPDVELNSRDSTLTFEGSDVMIHPIGGGSMPGPIVRTTAVKVSSSPQLMPQSGTPLRRASSFVLLTPERDVAGRARLERGQSFGNTICEEMLDLVLAVFLEQVLVRKDFTGFDLFTRVPPGFREHQAYFESHVLERVMARLSDEVHKNQKALCEPRILTNLSRLCLHLAEATFEGWFINGADIMIDFGGMLLEFLQRPDVAKMKSVRLCSQALSTIRSSLLRIILLKLSDLDMQTTEMQGKDFMNKLAYWQMSILECLSADDDYLKLFLYQLYTKLIHHKPFIRIAAANFLRIILVQKPDESVAAIRSCMTPDQRQLSNEFQQLTEVDDETFVAWVDKHRLSLDTLFLGSMAKTWEEFVCAENAKTLETAKARLSRRKERLKAWNAEAVSSNKMLVSHDIGNGAWMKSVCNTEFFKHQRLLQDQQDDLAFLTAAYRRKERDLRRPGAVFSESGPLKWKLDRTEGRNRMRLRLLPDSSAMDDKYEPRKKGGPRSVAATPPNLDRARMTPEPSLDEGVEEDFELVDNPEDADGDSFEDKNRKVLRRLQPGDQVQAAYNMSRITGLEACEGLFIVGKDALYMMDNVFQCVNGDIVNVWQAPREERDPFTMVVTGTRTLERQQNLREQESRHWKWQDVVGFSKRRFLFRDVAVEIFFTDGRSYLLALLTPAVRDELFGKMLSKAPHTSAANALPNPEDAWRLEALKPFDEPPRLAGLGSKLGTLFNTSGWNPVMKRWQRGDVSNFHYLMMVNTMAGRTFNDLTQYPVFPWILADYTSEDLDLEDPATFRDLSKPMGAQTPTRVSRFSETYNALREIGQTPFHYGTHYSSAMIVSSYLIRLPPFVQSYLLVQGDSFDHADRLFQSVGDAWLSASARNKTDVRELIPEFFCLPEFLTNINGYDFGRRQSNGARVDDVALPPWAKGDPRIFIAKHREALESPYVSENLHRWVDLVFGHKQRGEAAVENLNVFHHLSYAGASDLDRITDANERAITAGVIHNFGQTPHQVFSKPHPPREHMKCPIRRLDTAVFSLSNPGPPLLESHDRVASLVYASKLDRLLCAPPLRLNFPPYDKYLEWGYADNSIRFFFSDNRKPAGLFENLHTGQISCACFADSKTLITAGEDCVVSVFTVVTAPAKPVDLVPRSSVFGHKAPVTAMAVSKAFGTFVTASSDGQAFLWDLNLLFFIRKLPLVRAVECAAINDVTGDVMLCSGPTVLMYTLNGSLMLDQNICPEQDDYVHSCAFYEGAGYEWLENHLVFTGHSKGRVNVWRKSIVGGAWTLELLRRLDHVDGKGDANIEAGITCITPMPTCLYTGDEDGRVYEWNFRDK